MRILILTPAAFPALTGNAITTERWRRSLTEKGVGVCVLSSDALDGRAFLESVQSFRPDLIHIYHAFKSGALALNHRLSGIWKSVPLVVSPGGTDVNLDFEDPERKKTIVRVLGMASLIIAQSPEIVRSLGQWMPELAQKIKTIPKATTWFGNEHYDLKKVIGCSREDIVFFMPAGIRPIKGNLECLMAMEQVHQNRKTVRFIAAGPSLDSEYAARFVRGISRLAVFAHWIPSISPTAMRSAYESSDIVLNASLSEGLSNSLLEAVAAGRPFLASDIPGNRQTLLWETKDRQSGYLFDPRDPKDFVRKALNLVDDGNLRRELADMARVRNRALPNPGEEADGLIAAYQSALASKSG